MKAINLNLRITISCPTAPVTHVCSIVLQLTIKIISENHHSSVLDPTTIDVNKYLNKKKFIYSQGFTQVKHSRLHYVISLVQKMTERSLCISICQHEETVLALNVVHGLLYIDNGRGCSAYHKDFFIGRVLKSFCPYYNQLYTTHMHSESSDDLQL